MNWEEVSKPKKYGGFGIHNIHHMNLAFMTKMGWRILNESDSLWTKVILGKYVQSDAKVENFRPKQSDSNLWQGIDLSLKYQGLI